MMYSASTERLLLETYNVQLPSDGVHTVSQQTEDAVSIEILKGYAPAILQTHLPVNIVGDGNCLYRAVSTALFGSQDYHLHLRLITALEVILNRTHYDIDAPAYIDKINDNRVLVSSYLTFVQSTVSIGSYSDLLHMYAISAAIKKSLRSYYPPMLSSEFLAEPYRRKVVGHGVNSSEATTAIIMWTSARLPNMPGNFTPNHFVPLLERRPDDETFAKTSTPMKTKVIILKLLEQYT